MGDDRRDEHVDGLICRLPGLFGEGGMGVSQVTWSGLDGWVVDAWPDVRPTWIIIAYTYTNYTNFTPFDSHGLPVTLTLRGFAL